LPPDGSDRAPRQCRSLACGDRLRSITTFQGGKSSGSLVTMANGKTVTTTIAAQRVGACP
jgi:hypothetical protein